jgi:DHA1 family tetracycline resistance protein-like MFS transporter
MGSETHAPDTRSRRERWALSIVFATMLIDFAGYTLLVPLLPAFMNDLHASHFEVGLIVTVYALTQLIFLPVWGWASDRLGRRPAILGSLAGTTVAYGILIYAVYAESMSWVYVSRVLAGFFASSLGTAQAVVTDLTPPSQRARGMGVLGAAMGIGFVIGPALGGILGRDDVRIPFAFVMVVSFLNFCVAMFVLPESRPGDRAPWRASELARLLVPTPLRLLAANHGRRIGLYLYLFFHLFTAFAALESMFALFLLERFGADVRAAGFVFAWIGIWMALTQGWLLGRMSPIVGEWNLAVGGLTVMALGLAVLPFVPSLDGVYALAPVVAIGNGLSFPSLASLYSKACGADQAGELLGQSQSMATTGRIVGPMWAGYTMGNLGGWLATRLPPGTRIGGLEPAVFGLGSCFLIAGLLTLAAVAILLAAHRTLAPDPFEDGLAEPALDRR